MADAKGMSSCSGACAKAWPPLTTKGKPIASGSVKASQLGTIKRSDGTEQVTYDGHPLYYFDRATPRAGTTNGQGSDAFGAKWWLVSPSGSAITSSGAQASTGGSSSSSSSSSSGSSSWS